MYRRLISASQRKTHIPNSLPPYRFVSRRLHTTRASRINDTCVFSCSDASKEKLLCGGVEVRWFHQQISVRQTTAKCHGDWVTVPQTAKQNPRIIQIVAAEPLSGAIITPTCDIETSGPFESDCHIKKSYNAVMRVRIDFVSQLRRARQTFSYFPRAFLRRCSQKLCQATKTLSQRLGRSLIQSPTPSRSDRCQRIKMEMSCTCASTIICGQRSQQFIVVHIAPPLPGLP